MAWDIERTDEYLEWWQELSESQRRSIRRIIDLLTERGPGLGYPHSSQVFSSRHSRMRELRVQSRGRPLRIFYAFDPRRAAVLLIGGDKTGNDRFYDEFIPIADRIYDEHLDQLYEEGWRS